MSGLASCSSLTLKKVACKNKVYQSGMDVCAVHKKREVIIGQLQSYYIHDKICTPFEVEDWGNKVVVYQVENNGLENRRRGPKILELPYEKILGVKEIDEKYLCDQVYHYEKGNSILLKHRKNHYTHIGGTITQFRPVEEDEIEAYVSPMNHNDLPYPFAIGKKYTYLMLYNVYILSEPGERDPYGRYHQCEASKKLHNKDFKPFEVNSKILETHRFPK